MGGRGEKLVHSEAVASEEVIWKEKGYNVQSAQVKSAPHVQIQHLDRRSIRGSLKRSAPCGCRIGDQNVELVSVSLTLDTSRSMPAVWEMSMAKDTPWPVIPGRALSFSTA